MTPSPKTMNVDATVKAIRALTKEATTTITAKQINKLLESRGINLIDALECAEVLGALRTKKTATILAALENNFDNKGARKGANTTKPE